ncbi:hypothetical protein GALMADRAFT_1125112 [Galerina marginata CBS 339.88]|uniref:Uncharacterized protein n=1 Tax=Galerina marginata (strain CBS 339.88) TaxID=685588 RepID=A0A067TDI7_GALM3|nr:hypothetical protein GALMADRAFT_1125112 [Galerina marginata CBS 339.88]
MIHQDRSTENTTYDHRISVKFLNVLAKLFTQTISESPSDGKISLHPTFDKTLLSISSTLEKAISDNTQRPFLFLSTSYLVHRMFVPEGKSYHKDGGFYTPKPNLEILPWVLHTPIHLLLDTLLRYNNLFKPYRTSPFSLFQLVCEPIYLWQADSQKIFQALELPERDDIRETWHKRDTMLQRFDTRH